MREKAYMGGTEEDKAAFEDMFMDYQAYNKYLRDKYDLDMSTGGFMAATKESSKVNSFENALYAKEIFDKYSDKIFDNTLLDDMDR